MNKYDWFHICPKVLEEVYEDLRKAQKKCLSNGFNATEIFQRYKDIEQEYYMKNISERVESYVSVYENFKI